MTPEMNNVTSWIWWVSWVGTVALCLWKMIEGVVRPAKMLEWPFLACAMWLYFYGYMGWQATSTLPAYLGNGMADIGQAMAFVCLIGLLAGWATGRRIGNSLPVPGPEPARGFPYGLCWLAGIILVAIGSVGAYSVAQAIDEGEMNYRASSAYWYLLFYVGYPGLAIALWSVWKMKSRFVFWTLLVITLTALVAFMMPHVLNARRGPLFPAVIVLLLVPPLTMRRSPNRILYLGGLALAGVAMLLFLQIRAVTYTGGTWSEAFQKLDVDTALDRGDQAEDNEYVNNCQQIGTICGNGKYQYGTGHLELLFHWIPRQVWWNKPALGEGNYSYREMTDDMEQATGVRLLGSGAAIGGVADSFVQYGFLSPFYWFILSGLVGALYTAAVRSWNPWVLFAYTGFICASHWLISQSLSAAFVPGMYFELVPLGVWAAVAVYRYLTAAPRKLRPRRRVENPGPGSAIPEAGTQAI